MWWVWGITWIQDMRKIMLFYGKIIKMEHIKCDNMVARITKTLMNYLLANGWSNFHAFTNTTRQGHSLKLMARVTATLTCLVIRLNLFSANLHTFCDVRCMLYVEWGMEIHVKWNRAGQKLPNKSGKVRNTFDNLFSVDSFDDRNQYSGPYLVSPDRKIQAGHCCFQFNNFEIVFNPNSYFHSI